MVRAKRFELRAESEIYAILCVDSDGNKTLEHAFIKDKVSECRGVGVYDSAGRMLTINQGDHSIYLNAPDGSRELELKVGSEGEISCVVDPKAQVQLVIQLSLSCGGSVGNAPIKDGAFVFNFRWIA